MSRQQHPREADDRWVWRAAGLVAAGGVALLGGLVLSIFEQAPNYVPLTGATLLLLCYGAAAVIAYRQA